jgi:hypothetical protein
MHVQKTRRHDGRTIKHGSFQVRETIHVCAAGCRFGSGKRVTRRAETVTAHLLPRSTVGYDVMVFIGLERFLSHRQREEIREALVQKYAVGLSTGEVSHLTRCFLQYLETLHQERTGKIRQALAADGGYPLHIDATGEDGQGTLLAAFAGWRRWVLDAWKIPTERKEVILPALRSVANRFGAPCAVMRDLGKAMIPAVNEFVGELDGEIPVLSCHSHFQADVGKDLLDGSHGELRALFRRFKVRPNLGFLARELGRKIGADIGEARQGVRTWQGQIEEGHVLPRGRTGLATVRSLAQWVLDFKADGTDFGFPFDRPYLDLYDRCVTVRRAADAFLRTMPDDKQVQRALKRLARFLEPVVCETAFKEVAVRLRKRTELFDELRDALRLMPKSGGRKLTPPQQPLALEEAMVELTNVQAAVESLVASLGERRPERGPAQDMREAIDTMLEHIEIHGESLWGHVVCLPTPEGDIVIRVVDRTNNVLESEFGGLKQGERRRSGRKILTQDFERLPAAAALTVNLTRPDYVKLLCGSLDALPRAFAELDAARRNRALEGQSCAPLGRSEDPIPEIASAALPAADRPLLRSKDMRRRVLAAAKSRAPHTPIRRARGPAATAK